MSFPFHRLGVDSGLMLHSDLGNLVTPRKLGAVNGYSLIEHKRIGRRVETAIKDYFEKRRFSEGLVVKSILATAAQPTFPNNWKEVRGRILLNGASGDRAISHFGRGFKSAKQMNRCFHKEWKNIQNQSENIRNHPHECRIFSVEARNLFNFYHFMIETLHQLTLVPADAEVVNIVSRDEAPKPFVRKWIDQIFPELADKVKFVHPRDFDGRLNSSTLTPISGRHLLYQLSGNHINQINNRAPKDESWLGYDASMHHISTLKLNSVDRSLLDFQQIALKRADVYGCGSGLTRIYVARKPGYSRDRKMEGEDKLFAILRELGFVKICLEDLEPLEQIATMNSAECVVLQHGAGLANMIFGSPYTHFFEIGTGQTAFQRWQDFIPLAHVSQCHYHSIFVDMNFPAESGMPAFSKHGLVAPKLNTRSIRGIVEIVESNLNEAIPGKIAGLVYHAERIEGTQPDSMLWRLIKEQALTLGRGDFEAENWGEPTIS